MPDVDADEHLDSTHAGAKTVRFRLVLTDLLTDTDRIVDHSIDGSAAAVIWTGPYVVTDAATVVTGEPPCRPITFDVRLGADDELTAVVVKDQCIVDGRTQVGELVAGTSIREAATYSTSGSRRRRPLAPVPCAARTRELPPAGPSPQSRR